MRWIVNRERPAGYWRPFAPGLSTAGTKRRRCKTVLCGRIPRLLPQSTVLQRLRFVPAVLKPGAKGRQYPAGLSRFTIQRIPALGARFYLGVNPAPGYHPKEGQ